MKTKTRLKIFFIFFLFFVFNSLESYAISNFTYLNESENIKHKFFTVPNKSNTNSINYAPYEKDNPKILLNQTLDSEKSKTNSSLWSTILLNLATFLTSMISLLTLIELKKQRNLATVPRLHIASTEHIIQVKSEKISNADIELPSGLENKNLIKSTEPFPFNRCKIPLKIINSGSSPALNVKAFWYYDYEILKVIIKDLNELGLPVKFEINCDYFETRVNNELISMETIYQPTDNIDYILPFSIKNQEYNLAIPETFCFYTSLGLTLRSYSNLADDHFINSIKKVNGAFPIPSFYVEIEYYDNLNILHKDKFSVNFNIISLTLKKYPNPYTNMKTRRIDNHDIIFKIQIEKVSKTSLFDKYNSKILKIGPNFKDKLLKEKS